MLLNSFKANIILCVVLMLCGFAVNCEAQNYRSRVSGPWSAPSTWEVFELLGGGWIPATTSPTSSAVAINIRATHTVSVTSSTSGANVTVEANGLLTVDALANLTIPEVFLVNELTVNATGTLNINGTLTLPSPGSSVFNGLVNVNGSLANASTITSTTSSLKINNGGSYIHEYTTSAGTIPTATWNTGSTCEIMGYTSNTALPGGLTTQTFYNFRWNCANQASTIVLANNTPIAVNGDFIMSASGASASLQINGSTFTIGRDYIQTGGIFDMNGNANAGVVNIARNFSMTGGTLRKNGTGTGNVFFNGTAQTFTKNLPPTATINAQAINFTINPGSAVDFGTSVLDGSTGTFNLLSGGTLITAHTAGITTGASGTIQSTGTRTFSNGASYTYNAATVNQAAGNGLPAIVNNLTVNKTSSMPSVGVLLTAATSLTVNGTLTLIGGYLDMTTTQLLVGPSFATAGTDRLRTQNTSALPIPTGRTWSFGVTYNSTVGNQTVVPGTFGGLSLLQASTKSGQAGSINVNGTWTSGGGKIDFLTNNTPVVFIGTTNQTITDNGSDGGNGVFFKSLGFSGNGTKTLAGTGKFSVTSTGLLTMGGTAELAAGGFLYLKSDATGSANVGPITGGASITGNVNAETFFTGNGTASNRGTRMVASSVSTPSLYTQLKNAIFITGPGGTTNGFDQGGAAQPTAVTLNKYVESRSTIPATSQFLAVASINEAPPAAGQSVFLFFRGARDANGSASTMLNTPYSAPQNAISTFVGSLNQGNVNVNLSYTVHGDGYDGYNAVGNPYPAVIDWTLVTRNGAIDNMVSVIKPGGGMTTYSAGVVTNAAPANGSAPTPNTGTASFYIQPSQGFYVKTRATGTSLTFTEGSKSVANTPLRLLDLPADPKVLALNAVMNVPNTQSITAITASDPIKVLRIALKDAENTDETALVFKQGYESTYSVDDASYFSGTTVSLSSLTADNMPMAINFMPELNNDTRIKLVVNATATGNVSLNFTDISGISGKVMRLKDKYLNTTTSISATGTSYPFSIDRNVAASYGAERFELNFEDEKLPPAALLSFTAEKSMSSVKLKWMAASSTQDTFIVERSSDGIAYLALTTLNGGNASTRTYTDQSPLAGKNYYRIVQVDDLNHRTYSPALSMNFQTDLGLSAKADFMVYPNPVVNEIRVALKEPEAVQVNVYNLTGRLLTQKAFKKDDLVQLDVSTLMKGMHVLEVKSAGDNSLIGTSKFFKN